MTVNDLLMFTRISLTAFNIMFEVKDESLSSVMKQYRVSKQDLHDTLWEEFNISGMEVRIANTAFDFLIECCENQKDLKDTLVGEIRKDILMSSIYYSNVAPNAVNTQ
mgnify:CR=1 FL=1